MQLNLIFSKTSIITIEVLPDDKIYKIYQKLSEKGDYKSFLSLDIYYHDIDS